MLKGITRRLFGTEAKSLAEPSAELMALFGAPAGEFGVSAAQALSVPTVQSCIRLISEAAAALDVKVMRRVGGTEAEAPDHPVAKLLADGPNEWTDRFSFVRDMVTASARTE